LETVDISLIVCYSFLPKGKQPRFPLRGIMAINFEEKRRFPRIQLRAPLRYQIRGLPGFSNALSDDVSLGGVSFSNDKFIAPQTTVAVEINILSRMLMSVGRIAWSSPLPHSNQYRSGIEFLELNPPEKNYLKDYIDMQTGKL